MDIDSGEWVTACTTNTPSATAQGLKPGHLYMFEISAINKEGQSEPLFTGDPILAENPYSEYRWIRAASDVTWRRPLLGTFKTLLRHYAKQALTHSKYVKLGSSP